MEQSVDDYPAETTATTSWSVRALICASYGVVLALPAIWPGFIFGDDVFSHLIMSRHFVDQLWAGDWYPRWLSGMNAGLGSQVFHFYGPVPYYITALFRPFVPNDPEGWHQLALAASLAVIASGFAAYAWLKQLVREMAALIGAVLYMSAPYHLAEDLYQRFAFAELWGFVWMPLVLFFSQATARGANKAVVGLALCYALLIMTHLPTTLLFSVVPLIHTLWMAPPGRRLSAMLRVGGAMSLGIGMSALYLLPALTTQHYVSVGNPGGDFFYGHHFLFDGFHVGAVMDNSTYKVGVVTAATVGFGALAWFVGRDSGDFNHSAERFFWGVAGITSLLMMLSVSTPIWRLVPALQAVQFPWRFNIVLSVAVTALGALAVETALLKGRKFQSALLLGAGLALGIPSVAALGNHFFLAREIGRPSLDGLQQRFGHTYPDIAFRIEAAKMSRYDSFVPVWTSRELFSVSRLALDQLGRLGNTPVGAGVAEGVAQIQVTGREPGRITLTTTSATDAYVIVPQFYYPGWVARPLGTTSPLPLRPSAPAGLIELHIPPGEQEIALTFEATWQELTGRLVTIISLIVLLLVFAWPRSAAIAARVWSARASDPEHIPRSES